MAAEYTEEQFKNLVEIISDFTLIESVKKDAKALLTLEVISENQYRKILAVCQSQGKREKAAIKAWMDSLR